MHSLLVPLTSRLRDASHCSLTIPPIFSNSQGLITFLFVRYCVRFIFQIGYDEVFSFISVINVKQSQNTGSSGNYTKHNTVLPHFMFRVRAVDCSSVNILDSKVIIYNYPLKGKSIVVDVYRDAKHQGIYPPLFTDPEGDSCFSINQIRWIKKIGSL